MPVNHYHQYPQSYIDPVTEFPVWVRGVAGVPASGGYAWSPSLLQWVPIQVDATGALRTSGGGGGGGGPTAAVNISDAAGNALASTAGALNVSGPLTDTQLRAAAVPVSGTVAVSGTVPVSGTVAVSGTVPVSGPLTDTQLRAAAIPVSGPLTDTQLRAAAVPVSGPLTDTQLRAAAVPVSGTVAVSGTVPVSGPLTDTQLRAAAVPVSVAGVATETTLTALNTKTPALGQALMAASQPVAIASNQSAVPVSGTVTANQGTMAALPAGIAAIGDVGVQYRANATGAASALNVVAAATTNATIVKASAGRLLGFVLTNNATTVRYVKFHNQTTAPVAGTGVVQTYGIPPNGGTIAISIPGGVGFATGIGLTMVTGAALADATAVAANDVVGTIHFA